MLWVGQFSYIGERKLHLQGQRERERRGKEEEEEERKVI